MHFNDQSTGFEMDLPDGWRKLLRFEYVRNNVFKDILPDSLTEGPVLVGSGSEAMVITVRQTEASRPETLRPVVDDIAGASGLNIQNFSVSKIGKETYAIVVWKPSKGKKRIKSYFLIYCKLLWIISVLLNKDEESYDEIVKSFQVHPLVKKMMES
jgi:hypothetical protein